MSNREPVAKNMKLPISFRNAFCVPLQGCHMYRESAVTSCNHSDDGSWELWKCCGQHCSSLKGSTSIKDVPFFDGHFREVDTALPGAVVVSPSLSYKSVSAGISQACRHSR